MITKKNLLFIFSVSISIFSQTANADFRKAFDAYIVRDGETMLKEVKDAVDKKNNDGFILFLNAINIDKSTSWKMSFNDKNREKINQPKIQTTFETILNETQQKEIKTLINEAAQNSTLDVQYRIKYIRLLFDEAKNDIVNKDEPFAHHLSLAAAEQASKHSFYDSKAYKLNYSKEKEEYWMTKAAELGDAGNALTLALRYLNYPVDGISPSQAECNSVDNHLLCFKKDEYKGFYWLQKATESKYKNGLGMRQIAYLTGNILRTKFDKKNPDFHQAYLWYLLGLNSPDFGESSYSGGFKSNLFIKALQDMHYFGQLKIAAPELDAIWDDEVKRNKILYLKQSAKLPQWLLNAKNKQRQSKPIFTYLRQTNYMYKINVHSDGKVWLQLNTYYPNGNSDIYLQVPPRKVFEFTKKLKQLGFDNWPLVHSNKVDTTYWCGDYFHPCRNDENLLILRQNDKEKTVYLGVDNNLPKNYQDEQLNKKVAQVFALVEEYFPTQMIRCNVGNSNLYNQECVLEDKKLINIAH